MLFRSQACSLFALGFYRCPPTTTCRHRSASCGLLAFYSSLPRSSPFIIAAALTIDKPWVRGKRPHKLSVLQCRHLLGGRAVAPPCSVGASLSANALRRCPRRVCRCLTLLFAVRRCRAPNDDARALCAAVRPSSLGCSSSAVRACRRGALRVVAVCLFPVLLPRRAPSAILWQPAPAVNGKINANAPLTAEADRQLFLTRGTPGGCLPLLSIRFTPPPLKGSAAHSDNSGTRFSAILIIV